MLPWSSFFGSGSSGAPSTSTSTSTAAKAKGGEQHDPLVVLPKNLGVEVKQIGPEKGFGLFATKRFKPKDTIFEERPFLSLPLQHPLFRSFSEEGSEAPSRPEEDSTRWTCAECLRAVGISIVDSALKVLHRLDTSDYFEFSSFEPSVALPHIRLDPQLHTLQENAGGTKGKESFAPVVPCGSCAREVYCSEACRSRAWANHHSLLCSYSKRAGQDEALSKRREELWGKLEELYQAQGENHNAIFVARVIAWIISRSATSESADSASPSEVEATLEKVLSHFCHKSELDDDAAPAQEGEAQGEGEGEGHHGHGHVRRFFEEVVEVLQELIDPKNRFPFFWKVQTLDLLVSAINLNQQETRPWGPWDCYWSSVRSDAEEIVMSEDCMGIILQALGQFGFGATDCTRGAGLYCLQSRMNHSCDPNASVGNGASNHVIRVMANKHIKPGDEICFDYLKLPNIEQGHKRALLDVKYHFRCQCPPCAKQDREEELRREREQQQASNSGKKKGGNAGKKKKNANAKKKKKR